MARIVAAVAALVGWAGLALQLILIARNLGLPLGLWRFLGYFTILTNLGTAIVATAMALGAAGALAGARARLMAVTSIALVGIVYSLALRALWSPAGPQKLADMALHDAAPVLFVAAWLLARHSRLAWREACWAALPAVAYAIYALIRGQIDGWYAYWFFDPGQQSAAQMLAAVALLTAGTGLLALVFVALDRALARRQRARAITAI
jgi:hypothetical protein